MAKICISNPPYNLKWQVPQYAQLQQRFSCYGVPPKGNANFAFILSGIENCDKASFILPMCVLSSKDKKENEIRKNLIEKNFVEAVILCPDKMFEGTNISVCIILLNKHKNCSYIEFIDARETYKTEIREQRGQFGGKSHTNRVYKKEIKIFDDDIIKRIADAIKNKTNEEKFCKKVGIEEIRQNNYSLVPSKYIETNFFEETIHRSYEDIVKDLNRVTQEKNSCKLTIDETLAKRLGFDIELYKQKKDDAGLNELLQSLGAEKIVKDDYISFTKNKSELKFENKHKDCVSSILIMIMQTWKQHIYYLNNEQNRYLVELRDALLPDLISGKFEIK